MASPGPPDPAQGGRERLACLSLPPSRSVVVPTIHPASRLVGARNKACTCGARAAAAAAAAAAARQSRNGLVSKAWLYWGHSRSHSHQNNTRRRHHHHCVPRLAAESVPTAHSVARGSLRGRLLERRLRHDLAGPLAGLRVAPCSARLSDETHSSSSVPPGGLWRNPDDLRRLLLASRVHIQW